jgi:hypothetical protein
VTDQPDNPGEQQQGSSTPDPGLVQRLSAKLAAFQDELEDDEADFLSGIISVAADAISASGEGRGTTGLVSTDDNAESAGLKQGVTRPQLASQLMDQFNSAFVADPPEPQPASPLFIIPQSPPDTPQLRIIP